MYIRILSQLSLLTLCMLCLRCYYFKQLWLNLALKCLQEKIRQFIVIIIQQYFFHIALEPGYFSFLYCLCDMVPTNQLYRPPRSPLRRLPLFAPALNHQPVFAPANNTLLPPAPTSKQMLLSASTPTQMLRPAPTLYGLHPLATVKTISIISRCIFYLII